MLITDDGAEVLTSSPIVRRRRGDGLSALHGSGEVGRRPRRSSSTTRTPTTKIATITFNRPEYLNAPTSEARLRYADLLRGATVDDDVKVVVIRGVGENLGSGADLPDFMAGDEDARLAELRLEGADVTYPPEGSFRHGATMGQWYANVAAGNRRCRS